MTCNVKPAHISGVDDFKKKAEEYCRSNASGMLAVEWGGTLYQVEKSSQGVTKQASQYRIVRFFAAIVQFFTHRIGDGSWQSRTQRLQHAWCEVRSKARVAEQSLSAKAQPSKPEEMPCYREVFSSECSDDYILPVSKMPSKSGGMTYLSSLSDPRLSRDAFFRA